MIEVSTIVAYNGVFLFRSEFRKEKIKFDFKTEIGEQGTGNRRGVMEQRVSEEGVMWGAKKHTQRCGCPPSLSHLLHSPPLVPKKGD